MRVGYSGRVRSFSIYISLFLGARYIERHITLDRSMWGTDQSASLSGSGMKNLSDIFIPKVLGDGIKKFLRGKIF